MKVIEAHGASIPAIGLGTWDLRGDTCVEIVSAAIDKGYRHVDTAIFYENERDVGAGIRASSVQRDEIFLTTKVWPDGIRAGVFEREVEASLERLDVGPVDLLLIHWPPQDRDYDLWASLLDKAIEQGWTKHIGVSNFTVDMLDEMNRRLNNPLACNQVENHPFLDQSKVRAACKRHGMALVSYCPIYRGGELFAQPAISNAASAHGKSAAQIVLRWHMQHDATIAIPRTSKVGRLDENADVFDFELSETEMAAISALGSRNARLCDFAGGLSPQWD